MSDYRGIVLAGGSGTRLFPVTQAVSKQLVPIYDKPMIYYPLSVLMLAGINEIAIITTPEDQIQFKRLLGTGEQWGVRFEYIVQERPEGLAQAYTLSRNFLDGHPSAMVLGDNIFYGHGLVGLLSQAVSRKSGGTVFGYQVRNPSQYGVVDFGKGGQAKSIIEKPENPASNYAVTGLYFLDGMASELAGKIQPSKRGELEITSLLEEYLNLGKLDVKLMGRGYSWFDTGTHESMIDATNYVRTIQNRQGLQIGCLEEIAYTNGWIDDDLLRQRADLYAKNEYGAYLAQILKG